MQNATPLDKVQTHKSSKCALTRYHLGHMKAQKFREEVSDKVREHRKCRLDLKGHVGCGLAEQRKDGW